MGSRILSRSFHVEKWDGGQDEEDPENVEANTSSHSGMDVDEDAPVPEGGDEDGDDDVEDPSDVAMVPMADILNARYGSENAKLFYEENDLRMVTTKPIKAGEQIWNTYGDPPNSDLLRRYGHVDVVPLPDGGAGNPADIVEVRADVVVDIITQHRSEATSEMSKEKIDWWLDEGGDDVFLLEMGTLVPEALISLIRLLLSQEGEWEKAKEKGKPPKPKLDVQVTSVLLEVLTRRLEEYPTSLQMDEESLGQPNLSLNKRHAIIVRLGEKRILNAAIWQLHDAEQKFKSSGETKRKGQKRKGDESGQSEERSRKKR